MYVLFHVLASSFLISLFSMLCSFFFYLYDSFSFPCSLFLFMFFFFHNNLSFSFFFLFLLFYRFSLTLFLLLPFSLYSFLFLSISLFVLHSLLDALLFMLPFLYLSFIPQFLHPTRHCNRRLDAQRRDSTRSLMSVILL